AAAKTLHSGGSAINPLVFIHDGARPFVSAQIIRDCETAAKQYGASVPALQPVDTQKETDADGFITRHLVRARLAAVQTPQVFRLQPLLTAHRTAAAEHKDCTDDTEIWDAYVADGKTYNATKIVAGSSENKKITYPSDIPQEAAQEKAMQIRTGLGYDKHVLTEGRKLMLGGVEIPFEKGEAGHSDGDVLLHAITDALLGAAAMGDIGSYFPPSDAKWKDADSKMLLQTVWKDITAAEWSLGNLDCVIALEKPKFLPYRDEVRASIAKVLGAQSEQIFVKAKTGEKTGDVGTGKVVEAFATCLLTK
ncbi:MAG: 2-C-methyl-D-erythritol 2,4-cyclodiphosphate synthase, partial [Treponema sp.]|nr:2-C-methyl-D-erythritol 2,4-cyclodiphosphate synthase [Treponema sp.]